MAREELDAASDALRAAAADAGGDGPADRLGDQAEKLATLAAADRGPDQGRLDREMHVLWELANETDETATRAVERALAHVRAYRETVEGV